MHNETYSGPMLTILRNQICSKLQSWDFGSCSGPVRDAISLSAACQEDEESDPGCAGLGDDAKLS